MSNLAQFIEPAEITAGTLGIHPGPDREQQLRNWALVLTARNIPCRLQPERHPDKILVESSDLDRAEHELRQYIDENRNRPAGNAVAELPNRHNTYSTLIILALVGIFHNLTYFRVSAFGHRPIDWLALGRADSELILSGEWWRLATALTLHADGIHLLGNLAIGAYFAVRLCALTGSGIGWNIILWSGILGNAVNVFMQPHQHSAVGASTALFGAMGAAGMLTAVRNRKMSRRYWLLPLSAAVALLALLGAGGDNARVDVGAHICGFFVGAGLGYLAGRILTREEFDSKRYDLPLATAAAAAICIAWFVALLN